MKIKKPFVGSLLKIKNFLTQFNKNTFQLNNMDWKDFILNTVNDKVINSSSVSSLAFNITISPEEIDRYLELQKEIAKIIPIEANRPTIILHIKGKNRGNNLDDTPDFGFIGGMGPLSDANILKECIHKRENTDNFYAVLRSAPPPRKNGYEPTLNGKKSYLKDIKKYLHDTYNFCNQKYSNYAILSNTAHANFNNLKRMNPLNKHKFMNLVSEISKDIVSDTSIKKIVVLGTLEAANKKVYQKYLVKEKLDKEKIIYPNHENQIQLQDFIDKVKSSTLSENEGKLFYQLIYNELNKSNHTHVILGCTEIPLFLKNFYVDENKSTTFLEKLKQDFPHLKIVDSEDKMVDKICNKQIELENKKLNKFTVGVNKDNSVVNDTQFVSNTSYVAPKNRF